MSHDITLVRMNGRVLRVGQVGPKGRKLYSSPNHGGFCSQIPWGSDSRYTICELCGAKRYYKDGFNGEAKQSPGLVSRELRKAHYGGPKQAR